MSCKSLSMTIKTKLLLSVVFLFILLSAVFWSLSKALSDQIDRAWTARYVKKQIIFDKYRTLSPIMHEMKLVRKLANEPSIIAMAQDESNPEVYAKGMQTLEHYRMLFQDKSYFAAFTKTGHYYFNDSNNSYINKQLQYTLSQKNPNDRWFFTTLSNIQDVGINIDRDSVLKVTKVWINYILKDHNRTLGIIGTGFDFNTFLHDSVGIEQDGVKNYFIDSEMAIQLAKDSSMIDYASITKDSGDHKTINSLFDNPQDLEKIKKIMLAEKKSSTKDGVSTTWASIQGKEHLIGVTYLQEIGWYSLTIIDRQELTIVDDMQIFAILISLLALFILIINRLQNHLLIKPLNQLKYLMRRIQNGENVELPIIGTAEIAELSMQFKSMVDYIEAYNEQLEKKILERTATLAKSEQKFRALFDSTHEAVILLDENGFFECNQAAMEMFKCLDYKTFCSLRPIDLTSKKQPGGIDSEILIKEHIHKAFTHGVDHFEWLLCYYNSETTFYAEVVLTRIAIGEKNALQAIIRDISKRKKDEEAMRLLAFYDPLTLLPNRRLLDDRLTHAIDLCKRRDEVGALLFLDLDNFKPLNDEYGHDAGDILLIETARRIKECTRESDTVARFGGDEFVILLEGLGTKSETAHKHINEVANKLLNAIKETYYIERSNGTIKHTCSVSIGIAVFDKNVSEKNRILKQADSAMYKAKEAGRSQIYFDQKFSMS